MNIIDRGEDDPIPFELTPEERESAAFAQAQLRMDAMRRNARDRQQPRGEGGDHA